MPIRHLVRAGLFSLVLAVPAVADGLRPPSELPPPGFRGQQFVDSAGCVFLRAGVGERVTWVARISRERRQMCGLAPTFAAAPVVAAVAPAPVARAVPAPEAVAAVAPDPRPAPKASRAAVPKRQAAVARAVTVTCPAHAPVALRVALRDGGSKVLCLPEGAEVEAVVVPKGYRPAWTDDRLNPLRGIGTAAGEMAQDRVWTRKVPARLVVVTAPPPEKAAETPVVTRSTSTAPAAVEGRFLVQVGSFGVPANAERTRERLQALGLPVTGGRASIRGQAVQVVYAGPFAGAEAAQAALRAVRGAGFGDAFLR